VGIHGICFADGLIAFVVTHNPIRFGRLVIWLSK